VLASLGPSEPQSDAIRVRAIARKRDTFGVGMGDILLKAALSNYRSAARAKLN